MSAQLFYTAMLRMSTRYRSIVYQSSNINVQKLLIFSQGQQDLPMFGFKARTMLFPIVILLYCDPS